MANNYGLAFGPRIGVAYQIDPKTVFRAGFGVSYAPYTGGRYAGAPGANQTVNAPGVADPLRLTRAIEPAPCAASQRAHSYPKPSMPPVTR